MFTQTLCAFAFKTYSITGACFREKYQNRSKNLEQQLKELKSEIEVMKVTDRESDFDRLYDDQQLKGQNKFITMQKASQHNSLNDVCVVV